MSQRGIGAAAPTRAHREDAIMAKAAELDTELVNGLKSAKSKRAYFALVLKGSSDGALIISKTKVPATAIAEAKKQSGGSAVLKGFCQYEDGKYVFETAKAAPATAAQAVKAIAKRDAGMVVNAEFRVGTDAELLADEAGSSTTSPQAAQPKQDGAAVMKRVNAMTADIMAALGGPNKDRVKAIFAAIRDQLVSKDFAGATKNIDELEPLVKPVKAAASQPQTGAELMKRLNAMTAEIKTALAGPNKARIQPLFVMASGQIKNQELAAAATSLDELEILVRKSPADGPVQKGAEPTQKGDPALAAALQAWITVRTDAVGQLAKLVAAFKTSNHPKAATGIALLEAVINKNLTQRPATPQQVDELVRYLNTDDIFTDMETPNPFGFTVRIRQPLLDALGELKKHVA
jgi:hypothetical protein